LEPRIEPEIAFGLARAPSPGMDEAALLGCVEWVAHGFEIVQSLFPGWRFAAADTVAAFGLHGAYLLGPKHSIGELPPGEWIERLARFEIALSRDGAEVDRGRAADLLGGPLSALRHLVELLAHDKRNPPLAAGEIVTTGTVTRAFPVAPGETWRTRITLLPLDGISVRFA
jgi:2-oxo-3-hexenedioate decarboxylase